MKHKTLLESISVCLEVGREGYSDREVETNIPILDSQPSET